MSIFIVNYVTKQDLAVFAMSGKATLLIAGHSEGKFSVY